MLRLTCVCYVSRGLNRFHCEICRNLCCGCFKLFILRILTNKHYSIFVLKLISYKTSMPLFYFLFQNGYVFVYTGLIEFVDNKDQLAMVIGHEMAHALMLHAVSEQIRK